MAEHVDEVPADVLAAFGAAGLIPERLPGGQGTTWRAGQIVLKPADSVREGRWAADVYDTLTGPGFRVPRPVRAASGDWVARGWAGWRWVDGAAADLSGVSPRWPGLIAVSRALHAALARVPVPEWWGTVENPWTIGDQVAWGERDPGPLLGPAAGQLAGQVRRLLAALRPVRLPDQLLHADLAGNVLFADGAPPAVIDFSPLARPAGLPLAIAAVDVLMWHQARPKVLDLLTDEPSFDQLLARALVYRLITEIVLRAGTDGIAAAARAGQPVTDLVLTRLAGQPLLRRGT
ncbi:MAG TPA: phosphotransferase [Trebonia sp.]|nr:phosphotransferase [Trebonia sp.]